MMIGSEPRMGDAVFEQLQDARAFREAPDEILRRWGLGVAYAMRPNRIRAVPPLLAFTATRLLSNDRRLPVAADARDDCNGLCGLVSDLAPATARPSCAAMVCSP